MRAIAPREGENSLAQSQDVREESPIPEDLAERLRTARCVTVLTGAGVSAESGISTFRGDDNSYWSQFDPMALASVDGFRENPERVWAWYQWRREGVRKARPNDAHRAIAAPERKVPLLFLITQNVDDLHERAGSSNPLHLHGSILETLCTGDCGSLGADEVIDGAVPQCRVCGSPARPGVVWFGEQLRQPDYLLSQAVMPACDLCLVVGTSAVVQPAAGLVTLLSPSAAMAVVNPEPTAHTEVADWFLQGRAGVLLPGLVDAAFGKEGGGNG